MEGIGGGVGLGGGGGGGLQVLLKCSHAPESHESGPLIISMQGAPYACVTTGVGSLGGQERKKKGRELRKRERRGENVALNG